MPHDRPVHDRLVQDHPVHERPVQERPVQERPVSAAHGYRLWIALGGLAGLLAVAAAAGAAHALPGRLDEAGLRAVDRAVQMQGWHALALVGVGAWGARGGRLAHLAGACFALGTVLFCGGVYASVLDGPRLGPVAPLGGVVLMLGWLLLGASALRRR